MTGLSPAEACAFWTDQIPDLANHRKQLLTAEAENRLLGTAVLAFAHQPNAPRRAEPGKMLVHSSVRRQGLGRVPDHAYRPDGRLAETTIFCRILRPHRLYPPESL